MPLCRLIYYSTVREGVDQTDVSNILKSAKRHNIADHLSGVLCFDRRYFLQVLEGARETVSATFGRICQDSRHRSVTLVNFRTIDERLFPDWDMTLLTDSHITGEICRRFSGSDKFDPAAFTDDGVVKFLRYLTTHR